MEAMEVCVTDEEYMMTKAKSFLETDCYRCRSWLLTAKSMFPNNFGIHVRLYTFYHDWVVTNNTP